MRYTIQVSRFENCSTFNENVAYRVTDSLNAKLSKMYLHYYELNEYAYEYNPRSKIVQLLLLTRLRNLLLAEYVESWNLFILRLIRTIDRFRCTNSHYISFEKRFYI